MRSSFYLAVLTAVAFAQPALASGYMLTYQSGKLSPYDGMAGVKGAKRLKITWSIPSLPAPGKCETYDWKQVLVSYTDGRNTLEELLQKYVYDNDQGPFLNICLKRDSEISQESTFIFPLFTNIKGINYSEYLSFHATAGFGRNAILSVNKYKKSTLVSSSEDESKGGLFTVVSQ